MLMVARRRQIVEIVRSRKSVMVRDLARQLKVTEETIRRDLEHLEADSKLLRSHGGAVLPEARDGELHFTERQTRNIKEKRSIAAEAVSRVMEGDTLMLDPSSTVLEMAKLMPDLRVTVITNSLQVQMELAKRRQMTVISLGGTLAERSLSTQGPQAERGLEHYHASKMFFSCKGVDEQGVVSESSELMARMKQAMFLRADKKFLLADHSKFWVKSLTATAQVEDVDEIITDSAIESDVLKTLQKKFTKVTVANF